MSDAVTGQAVDAAAEQPPLFEAHIAVEQTGGATGIAGMLTVGMLGGIPAMALAYPLIEREQSTGWFAFLVTLGILGCIVLWIVGMFAGFMLWFAFEERWRTWRGKKLFSGTARVRIDQDGLFVEGLALNVWREVLGWEGVPDSDNYLIVHTQRFGGLLLSTPVGPLVEALGHYQAAARAEAARLEIDSHGRPNFEFKALVFHWPGFYAWILLGYLLAGALAVGLLAARFEDDAFKALVGCVVVCPLVAWLVWAIPLARISLFSARAMRSFVLHGNTLEMGDGAWSADLSTSRVVAQSRSGLAYDLSFLTVVPRRGRRLDLVVDEPERALLIEQINAMGVRVEQRQPHDEPMLDENRSIEDFEAQARENRSPPPNWHRYY
jgi:hypothetical protein